MKISDEARKAARDAALFRWGAGSADTTQMLLSVDAALAALPEPAVPYLMPDREALTFAQAIRSDLDTWTEDECRLFLRQFAEAVLGSEVPSDQPS
jgi:hypothetical protein